MLFTQIVSEPSQAGAAIARTIDVVKADVRLLAGFSGSAAAAVYIMSQAFSGRRRR